MATKTSMNNSFEFFLTAADLETWNTCLESLNSSIPSNHLKDSSEVECLVQCLIVSCYVQWLSSVSGNKRMRNSSKSIFTSRATMLKAHHRRSPSDQTEYGIGILAGWFGYRAEAQKKFSKLNMEDQTNILWLLPDGIASKAARLREYVIRKDEIIFPPILYFYCDALLTLGSMKEVALLIDEHQMDMNSPMTIDLLGKIQEQNTEWGEASAVYARSSWPVHFYRAIICKRISEGRSSIGPGNGNSIEHSEEINNYLSMFEGEISQLEVARISAFINACRWNEFDDWIINYEWAKLSFRLRRHAEAEKYFNKAFDQSPSSYRSAIANLRFGNLTWMSGNSLYQDLDLTPEALECGRIALENAEDIKKHSHISCWIATATNNGDFFKNCLGSEDYLNRGSAFIFEGEMPSAIKAWRTGLTDAHYYPRLHHAWITLLDSCQFDNTFIFFIKNIIENSADDFFNIWELAQKCLLPIRRNLNEFSSKTIEVDKILTQLANLLEKMSHYNFQNLIRAYEFFVHWERQDIAESLLDRASKLAESSEEFLELAIARRKVKWFSSREGDQLGLTSLSKAEKESRDRLERLQIAREYCYYGQMQRARSILIKERIFESNENLFPIEYIVALQCQICFQEGELLKLFETANSSIKFSQKAGVIRYYLEFYLDRVSTTLNLDQSILRRRFSELGDSASATEESVLKVEQGDIHEIQNFSDIDKSDDKSRLKTWRHKIEKAEEAENAGLLGEVLDDLVSNLDNFDLDTKIWLWEWIYNQMGKRVRIARRVRPETEPDATPITKSGTVLNDWRAQELTDLWKKYIHCENFTEKERILQEIKAFNLKESILLKDWEIKRNTEKKPNFFRALLLGKCAKSIIESIQNHGNEAWPIFWDLQPYLNKDIIKLKAELNQRINELSLQLS